MNKEEFISQIARVLPLNKWQRNKLHDVIFINEKKKWIDVMTVFKGRFTDNVIFEPIGTHKCRMLPPLINCIKRISERNGYEVYLTTIQEDNGSNDI